MKKLSLSYVLIFSFFIFMYSNSYAYFGVKVGGFTSGGETSWGGGLVYGLPLPVKGLAIEAEESGYYNSGTPANLFSLQTSAGPVYDFNPLITPESNFFHPYVRGGVVYAFLFSDNDSAIDDQSGPGFFTGAGITLNFPVVSVGFETNYNYVNFDSAVDNDYWNYFISGGVHF